MLVGGGRRTGIPGIPGGGPNAGGGPLNISPARGGGWDMRGGRPLE